MHPAFLEQMPEDSCSSLQRFEMYRHLGGILFVIASLDSGGSEGSCFQHQAPYAMVVGFTVMPGLGRLGVLV